MKEIKVFDETFKPVHFMPGLYVYFGDPGLNDGGLFTKDVIEQKVLTRKRKKHGVERNESFVEILARIK